MASNLLNGLAASGAEAQARIGLVNAACEYLHRSNRSYRFHWQRYARLAEKHAFLKDVDERTFRNVLTRQSKSGDTFDVFDAVIVLHLIRDGDAELAGAVDATLTAYQRYLIDWSGKVLRGAETSRPRLCEDPGIGGEATRSASYLETLTAMLEVRNADTSYWDYFYGKSEKAGFVMFRHGLKEKGKIIQTYINISSNKGGSTGVHTYAHVYLPRRNGERRMRLVRGFAIPTHAVLYLIGFQDTSKSTGDITKMIDLRQPVEMIAIPVTGVNADKARFAGLTLTTNEEGQLLVARTVLRRTSLDTHAGTQAGFYDARQLKDKLTLLHGAEQDEGAQSELSYDDLKLEIDDILSGINNLVDLHIPDLLSGGRDKSLIEGADLLAGMLAVFKAGGRSGALSDPEGRAFHRRFHWRLGAIGQQDPRWE